MPSGRRDARQTDEELESTDAEERQAIDSLIDDMGAQSFPASDPPAWGAVSSRLEETKGTSARLASPMSQTPLNPPSRLPRS